MRAVSDVRAQQDLRNSRLTSSISSLPPSYVEGFKHTVDKDGIVTIAPGITTVQGSRVEMTADWTLSDNDWIGDKTASSLGDFYYTYLTRTGQIKVDRSSPAYSSEYFYNSHPFYGYRVIGKLFVYGEKVYWCSSEYRTYQNKAYIASSSYLGDADYYIDGDASYLVNMAAIYLSKAYGGGTIEFSPEEFDFDNPIVSYASIMYRGELQTVLKTDDNISLFTSDVLENVVYNMTLRYYGGDEIAEYLIDSTGDRFKVLNCKIDHPGCLGVSLGGAQGTLVGCDLTGGKSGLTVDPSAEESFSSDTCTNLAIGKISDSLMVLAYTTSESGEDGFAHMGTIESSGEIIAAASAVTFSSGTVDNLSVDVRGSKVAIAYDYDDGTNNATLIIGEYSGGSLTFGTASTWWAGTDAFSGVKWIDDDRVVICGKNIVSPAEVEARIANISGTTISSYGTQVQVYAGSAFGIGSPIVLDDTRIFFSYIDITNSVNRAVIYTYSGDTLTLSESAQDISSTRADERLIVGKSSESRVLALWDSGANAGADFDVVNISSDNIISYSEHVIDDYSRSVGMSMLGEDRALILHNPSSGLILARTLSVFGSDKILLSDGVDFDVSLGTLTSLDDTLIAFRDGTTADPTVVNSGFEHPISLSVNSSGNANTISQNQIYGTEDKFIEVGILSGGTGDIITNNQIVGEDNKRILYGIITDDDCERTQVLGNNISNVAETAVVIQGTNVKVDQITAWDNGDLIDRGNCESNVAPMIADEVTEVTSNCTWARDDTQASSGTYSYVLTVTSGGTAAYASLTDSVTGTTDMHGLIAGKTYKLKADIYIPAGAIDYDEINLRWGEYYSASWNTTDVEPVDTTDAWQTVENEITITDDTTGIYIEVYIDSTAASSELIYVDNIQLIPIGIHNQHSQQYIDLGEGTSV